MSNLDGDIAERLKKPNVSPAEQLRLVETVLARGQYLAKVADLALADDLSKTAVETSPKSSDAHLARALAHNALHRFDAATKELDKALELGAAKTRVDPVRQSIALAKGQYDEALALQLPEIETRSSTDIATAAVIAARMQKPDEAERLFELARQRFSNVAPFPLAWMDFQRATVLEANGKDVAAREYYAEACEVLPPYAHAAVHLAAAEPADKAITRLEALRATSDDADVIAALAEAHRRAGHADDTKRLVEEAKARYDVLVSRHPEAFGDHAARFHLGPGADPQKALALAKENARLRPTEDALDLWMAAAAGASAHGDVCAASAAMSKLRYASERTRRVAAASLSKCSDGGDAGR